MYEISTHTCTIDENEENKNEKRKCKEEYEESDIEENIKSLIEEERVITRKLSIGLTGETYYDYDLPLSREDSIIIIHYNDVYDIEENSEGEGGISRFINALRKHCGSHPLIFFSGDAFNPSTLSSFTKGRHMVPFLNMTKIHTACFGNHDFDFGVDHLEYLAGSSRFLWVLSNVYDKETQRPLANAVPYRLFEWQGIRIGIFGLVEQEWLETLACIDQNELIYKDFVEVGREISKMLVEKEAELIIALTHMRYENDEKLALSLNDIDLILGGHDHEYYGVKKINNKFICKSGTDFRNFTKITIKPNAADDDLKAILEINDLTDEKSKKEEGKNNNNEKQYSNNKGSVHTLNKLNSILEWERIDVNKENYARNSHVDLMVERYIRDVQIHMNKIIGETEVPLETRFAIIRTQEANTGNWICDLMRKECRTDIAILNSGTIRSDCIIKPGKLRLNDIMKMFPMNDLLTVVEINGEKIVKMLENSVSLLPRTEGRFLQVSGIQFKFKVNTKGNRVDENDVYILDKQTNKYAKVDKNRTYTLAVKEYLYNGKDGYDMITSCKVLRDAEVTPSLHTIIRNSFSFIAMMNGFKKPHSRMMTRVLTNFSAAHYNVDNIETETHTCPYKISPKIDGRIIRLD